MRFKLLLSSIAFKEWWWYTYIIYNHQAVIVFLSILYEDSDVAELWAESFWRSLDFIF